MATQFVRFFGLAPFAMATLLACHGGSGSATGGQDKAAAPGTASASAPLGLLATVNGVPITENDLAIELHNRRAQGDVSPEQKAVVLDHVIQQELVAEKAVEKGLDSEKAFQEELARRTTEVNAWKRQALAELYYRHEASQKGTVAEAELRKFFDDNASWIRTDNHVWQILARDGTEIAQLKKELDAGVPFETVAARKFPDLKEGQAPWDVGMMKWKQVPDPWRPVLEKLKPGETSDVISGAGHRWWIIRLIDRREDPTLDFDQVKDILADYLRVARAEQFRSQAAEELRKAAKIIYVGK